MLHEQPSNRAKLAPVSFSRWLGVNGWNQNRQIVVTDEAQVFADDFTPSKLQLNVKNKIRTAICEPVRKPRRWKLLKLLRELGDVRDDKRILLQAN